ncbi:MAG TPA: XRE family transcriptional regulator [Candidatus Competibacteraceae bacterium]|jgi:transcriptional regulator with XRE-family HTH domain|nr:XRE family transcriptional regulator [Candidatus Competibacteraceae bacterium]
MDKTIYAKRVFLQVINNPKGHRSFGDTLQSKAQDEIMEFKVESGRRLRQCRDRLGLTLEELAARTPGISASRISNYEQALRLMRQPEAIKLAKVLGVSAAYLMCVDDGSWLPPRARKLLDLFESSDARGKITIEKVAETQASLNVKALPAPKPASESQR